MVELRGTVLVTAATQHLTCVPGSRRVTDNGRRSDTLSRQLVCGPRPYGAGGLYTGQRAGWKKVSDVAHTAICDACDVVMQHPTEAEANDWVFAHVREVHDTTLDEADVIDLANGGTETIIWPPKLPLDADREEEAMVRITRRASTTSYLFMRKVSSR